MLIAIAIAPNLNLNGHWSVNEEWVLKRPFHADKKDGNTSITL
jgi:hypothetical protein